MASSSGHTGIDWSKTMKIRKSLVVLALAFCQPAIADYELVTLINAVETSPANIILPATVNGMMTYRPCAEECESDYERARLTADTTFTVEGRRMKYEDFTKVFNSIKQRETSYALVSVETKSKTVTSIDLAR
jgi:hypothetical protein